MEQKKERCRWGGGSVAGQTAPAKQRIYCHGKASFPCSVWHSHMLTHTHTHTNLRQRLDQSFLLPLKLLPNLCLSHIHAALLLPPHPHASSILLPQTKVRSRQTDNQTRARSVHKISVRTHPRHTLTYMMSRIHLPWQPNNEPRWHSSPSYLSAGRLEKRSRPSCLGALLFSFSLNSAFTFSIMHGPIHSPWI